VKPGHTRAPHTDRSLAVLERQREDGVESFAEVVDLATSSKRKKVSD
jgi:hypothetical protein